jgi:hypothetical protein
MNALAYISDNGLVDVLLLILVVVVIVYLIRSFLPPAR